MPSLSKMWSFLPSTITAAIIGGLFLYWRRQKGKRLTPVRSPPGSDLSRQSIPVKGKPGVYKCGYLLGDEEFETYLYPEVTTLYDVFLRGLQISENGKCLGERADGKSPFEYQTYAQVWTKAKDFGSALVGRLGQKPGNNTNLGIYAKNCSAWFISTLGAMTQSAAVVPLYDTLGADAANFIVQQAEIQVIVTDNGDKARRLVASKGKLPTLKHIVVMAEGDVTEELEAAAMKAGVHVHTFADVLREGHLKPQPMMKPKSEDTYLICYTSGTTGLPKGVVLSHLNVVSNLTAFVKGFLSFLPAELNPSDNLISYLPLSHMMEQMAHWALLIHGSHIGYFRGDIRGLTDDIKELRPTIFPVVPRLLNRLYDTVQTRVASLGLVGRTLFSIAYAAKLEDVKRGSISNDSIWDKLVFKKIQAAMGGRVKLMVTGSAPISEGVLEACRVAFGCAIVEGYGQTECTAMASSTWPGDGEGGHCGGAAVCATLKLADIPELNYYASEGKGEVLVKGPSVCKGYYKDPVKTAELFDEEGFLKTGDVGWIRPNGSLKIIDRKKHIFKLAQGEYVAPEKIEQVYTRAPVVQQVYVDGDSLQRWLIAVVVPESEVLMEWDEKENGSRRKMEAIIKDPKTEQFVLEELQRLGKENKLNSIEQVKKVIVESEAFSIDNGLLTPTLKSKRPQLRAKYADQFKAVYSANPNL